MKTDALDEQILAILTPNARISNREVARELGVADVTVGKRLNRLQRAGMVQASALVDPRAVGLDCLAFVRLITQPGRARAIAEAAAALECVSFVALMAGRHSVVTGVLVENRAALASFVHDHFRTWEGVLTIEVREIVTSCKHRLDVVLIAEGATTPPRRADRRAGAVPGSAEPGGIEGALA